MKIRIVVWMGLAAISLNLLLQSACFAQEKHLRLIGKGQYFDVYASSDIDLLSLLAKLDYQIFQVEHLLATPDRDLAAILAHTLDAIYLETSDILDIRIYSYRGNVKFLPNARSVAKIFETHAGKRTTERAFYYHEQNTIYISAEDVALGMLGHEMAHAIISRYFVVPPPMKVQEVLAGYVDFHLQKKRGKSMPKK